MKQKRIAKLKEFIATQQYDLTSEQLVQSKLEQALKEASIDHVREFSFDKKDRIDFLVEGSLGIEVKLAGSLTQVTRQIHRYVQHDQLETLILVTSKPQLAKVPKILNGKKIIPLVLISNFL
jgi:hypothetical protein